MLKEVLEQTTAPQTVKKGPNEEDNDDKIEEGKKQPGHMST